MAQDVVADVYQSIEQNSNANTDSVSLNKGETINKTIENTIEKIIREQIESSHQHIAMMFENFIQESVQKQTLANLSKFNNGLDKARDKLMQQLSTFIEKAVKKPLTQSQIKFNEVASLIVSLIEIIDDLGTAYEYTRKINDNLSHLNHNYKTLEGSIAELKKKKRWKKII